MATSVRNTAIAVLDFVGQLALAPTDPSMGRPLVVRMALINNNLEDEVQNVPSLAFMVNAANATPNEVRESLARRFPDSFTLGVLGLKLKTSVLVMIDLFCARMHGSGPQALFALSPTGNNRLQPAPNADLVAFWTCRLAVADEGSMESVVRCIERLVATNPWSPINAMPLSENQKKNMRGFVRDLVHYGQLSIGQWTLILS